MVERIRVLLIQTGIVVVTAAMWEVIGRSSSTAFFLVGSPTEILREFTRLLLEEGLTTHFIITGAEAAVGITIGTIAGSLIGLALWYSERSARVTRPFIVAIGALPIFAFAPLMIVWFGVGFKMKAAMATFATIFLAISQAYRGASLVSDDLVVVFSGMKASRRDIFRKAIVPGSLSWVFGSMRVNGGLGLLGAFIGEFIASDQGLGYIILRASGLYNVPRALAAAVGILALALIFDRVAALVESRSNVLVQWISVSRALWSRSD